MFAGALLALALRQVSLQDAVKSKNIDVILFLIGMFIVGAALKESGMQNPFVFLSRYLSVPTILNLISTFLLFYYLLPIVQVSNEHPTLGHLFRRV